MDSIVLIHFPYRLARVSLHDRGIRLEGAIVTKTLSFAVVHFIVAFSVGFALTGSLAVGGAIAVIEPMLNTVAYFFHEKAWERVRAPARGLRAQAA